MTLRDLGPQALVSRNMLSTTSISDERFRRNVQDYPHTYAKIQEICKTTLSWRNGAALERYVTIVT
jgi:hypothetical protein